MSGQRRCVPPAGAGPGIELDLAAGMGRDALRQPGDADLLGGADVIDAEMLAALAHDHDAVGEVVDMAEAARLAAVALNFERDATVRPRPDRVMEPPAELRDDVLEAHVGAVHVVRPEDQHALQAPCGRS